MGRFFLFLLRLVAVMVGFAAACLLAACVEVGLNASMMPGGLAQLQARGIDLRLTIGLLGLAGLIGHAAFVPSAVTILAAEAARLRNWLAYALGGAVIAAVVVALAWRAGVAVAMDSGHLAVDLVAGMLGGVGYWLVAGHGAGRWLPSQRMPAADRPSSAE